jgi:glutamate synthase (NADPH/NADH) small chain
LEFERELPHKRPVKERVKDYREFVDRFTERQLNQHQPVHGLRRAFLP